MEGSAYILGIQGQGVLSAPMIQTIVVALENSLDFFEVLRHFNQYVSWAANIELGRDTN